MYRLCGHVIRVLLTLAGTLTTGQHSQAIPWNIFTSAMYSRFVTCYSTGAPWFTCLTMFPVHSGAQRQSGECPFQVLVGEGTYNPMDRLTLTINSKTAGRRFKGFQIRTRPKYGDTERIVGQFVDLPNDTAHALDCLGDEQNVVTNKDGSPLDEILLTWLAPGISYGDIEFVASFVEDFHTFWTEVTVPVTATVNAEESSIGLMTSTFEENIDWSACGVIKGCFLYPRLCTGDDCYAAVTYRIVNGSAHFEMFGPKMGYISVGFSDDRELGHEETITCTGDMINTTIQRGHNDEHMNNDRQLRNGIKDVQTIYRDDRLYCRFTRPLSMEVFIGEGHKTRKIYNLQEKHHLILMWGDIFDGTDVIHRYKELPPITDTMVDLHVSEIVRGSALPFTIKMHGTLMLLAWMLMFTISLLIARHFKGAFHTRNCGYNTWLKIHAGLNVVAWLLTVAAFILVFIVVGKMTERAKVHSYMGITVMSASTLQIIMGICRPVEQSSKRIVYTWGHWFLGKCTHILAGVTFLFAFLSDIIPQPQKHFAYIVLGVYTAVLVMLDMYLDVARKVRLKNSSEKYEVQEMKHTTKMGGFSGDNSTDSGPGSIPCLILYIICVVGVTTAAITCIHLY